MIIFIGAVYKTYPDARHEYCKCRTTFTGFFDKSNHQEMFCKTCILKMLVKPFKNTYEVFFFGIAAGYMSAKYTKISSLEATHLKLMLKL